MSRLATRVPGNRTRVSTLPVYDNMNRYANGATSGAMQTGQAWSLFQSGAVQNGWFDSTSGSAVYLECNSGRKNILRIGAEWVFNDQGGTLTDSGSTMTLISWADGGIVTNGFGRRTSLHVAITRSAMLWYVRDVENGGTVTLISNQTISPALPLNELVGAEATIDPVAHTGRVKLKDGRTYNVSDSRIAAYTGEVYACWEPYYNGSTTSPRIQIGRVWTDGEALPPAPITPTFVSQTYNSTTANVTSLNVVLPTLQTGDTVILMAEGLANTLTIGQSAGPTFTKHGTQNNRTGISTALFYKTAASGDSGQTVTITSSTATPMHLGVWVLRNVAGVYTAGIAMTNQASGSSTVTFPAYTAATGRTPLQIVSLGRSANAAATLTPGANTTILGSQLPTTTGVRSGLAIAGVTNFSDTLVPGSTWTNTSDHYAATWLVPITL